MNMGVLVVSDAQSTKLIEPTSLTTTLTNTASTALSISGITIKGANPS